MRLILRLSNYLNCSNKVFVLFGNHGRIRSRRGPEYTRNESSYNKIISRRSLQNLSIKKSTLGVHFLAEMERFGAEQKRTPSCEHSSIKQVMWARVHWKSENLYLQIILLAEMERFELSCRFLDKRISSASRYDHFGTSPWKL